MKRSTHRILTTHCGSLPRPNDLLDMLMAREQGSLQDPPAFQARVRQAIGECVRKQMDTGLDIVNDGEWSKPDYSTYVKNRFTGFEGEPTPIDPGRDLLDFPEYAPLRRTGLTELMRPKCNGPIAWKDFDAVERDIDNLKAAAGGATEVFMTAASPGVSGTLPGQRRTTSRRGVPLGPRRRPQRRVQSDHRRRLHRCSSIAPTWRWLARAASPAQTLAEFRQVVDLHSRYSTRRPRTSRPSDAPPPLLGQLRRPAQPRHSAA